MFISTDSEVPQSSWKYNVSSSNFYKKLPDTCEVSGNEVECPTSKTSESYVAVNEACCMPQGSCYKALSAGAQTSNCPEQNRPNEPVPYNSFSFQACKETPATNYQILPQFPNQDHGSKPQNQKQDYAYNDLFGRHCSYAPLLNGSNDQDTNRHARFSNDKEAHCQYGDPYYQFSKSSFSDYQEVGRARDEDRANTGDGMVISSSRSETVYDVQSPKNDGSMAVVGRGNILASPGNSCIVSSTDAGRTYSEEAGNQKPGWNDKAGEIIYFNWLI